MSLNENRDSCLTQKQGGYSVYESRAMLISPRHPQTAMPPAVSVDLPRSFQAHLRHTNRRTPSGRLPTRRAFGYSMGEDACRKRERRVP